MPKPQPMLLEKVPMKVTFAESGPRNVASYLLTSPDHIIQKDTTSLKCSV